MMSSIDSSSHDPIAMVIYWVTMIFCLALLGRFFAKRFSLPGVLGELIAGIILGNLCYFFNVQIFIVIRECSSIFHIMRDLLTGDSLFQAIQKSVSNPQDVQKIFEVVGGPKGIDYVKVAYILDILSRYGVIFLLFMVGLESSFDDLKHTGIEAVRVAVIGVAAPVILGFGVAFLLLPHVTFNTALFVAATLSATSIGITARVLSEFGKLHTREAKTILGAAMLDDVLGLIILAIVTSIVVEGHLAFGLVVRVIFEAILFFLAVLTLGPWILRKSVKCFALFEIWEAKLFVSFIFVMFLAWLATVFGLASIIGAFAAGLVIHDGYFEIDEGKKVQRFDIKNLVAPLEAILAPLFFMLIGIQVKLEAFLDWHVLLIAAVLIVVAIVGKLVSGLGANQKDNRLLIGIGMMPRGEVGIVFASIGKSLGVMSDALFSAIVLMIIMTTLIAPILLKEQFNQQVKLKH